MSIGLDWVLTLGLSALGGIVFFLYRISALFAAGLQ